MSISTPPDIPGYTLERRIGKGGMGEVWLGEHQRNKRKVAIKLLYRNDMATEDQEKLFLREAEVLAGFNHRNIVTIHDNDQVGDVAYLVMELLPGGTLAQRMKDGPLSVGEALALIVQIASALEQIHSRDMVHRDLKPENIMLRDATTPVITDFGTVKLLNRTTYYGKDGMVVGSVPYMSPEQINGGTLSAASDLYALGICMYELLTGDLPYRGSRDQIVTQHFHGALPKLPAGISMLQPILDKMLAKSPEARFAAATDFLDALRQVFLSDEALRLQVGYSSTGMAWSSQLRALGFPLDREQKNEVRIRQGAALAGSSSESLSATKTEFPVSGRRLHLPWIVAALLVVALPLGLWPMSAELVDERSGEANKNLQHEVKPQPSYVALQDDGLAAANAGDLKRARDRYQAAAEAASTLVAADRDNLSLRAELADLYRLAGYYYWASGSPDKGKEFFKQALSVVVSLPASMPRRTKLLFDIQANEAMFLHDTGEKAAAIARLENALTTAKGLDAYAQGMPNEQNGSVYWLRFLQANWHLQDGEVAKAYIAIDVADALLTAFLGATPGNHWSLEERAKLTKLRGWGAYQQQDFDLAADLYGDALSQQRKLDPPDKPSELQWNYQADVGSALQTGQRPKEAYFAFRECIKIADHLPGILGLPVGINIQAIASRRYAANLAASAEAPDQVFPLVDQAVQIGRQLITKRADDAVLSEFVDALRLLGYNRYYAGKREEGRQLMEDALTKLHQMTTPAPFLVYVVNSNLADALHGMKLRKESLPFFQAAIAAAETLPGAGTLAAGQNGTSVAAWQAFGNAALDNAESDAARSALNKAREIARAVLGSTPQDMYVATLLKNIEASLEKLPKEAGESGTSG